MTVHRSRIELLQGAAFIVTGSFAALTIASPAAAQSVCQINPVPSPDTFSCTTGGTSPVTATGTLSDGVRQGETFIYPQGLVVNSPDLLVVTLSGQIISGDTNEALTPRYPPAVMINNNAPVPQGAVVYTSTGTTISQGSNTIITGTSVVASTGTIIVNGPDLTSTRYGLFSISNNGRNVITGGATSFTDVTHGNSVGIYSTASGGEVVVNSGNVILPGSGSGNLGIYASSRPSSRGICAANGVTVNITGNVTVTNGTGIGTDSCSVSTVNVNSGRTISTRIGPSIVNTAATAATTNISGTVNAGAANLAIDVNGTSSDTTIAPGGVVIGRFDGTAGNDLFVNNGQFTTTGVSDFQAGADQFTNNGTLAASGSTTLAGLETFSNSGTISMGNGAPGDVLILAGNYSGSGAARLLLEVGATGSDRLVISGSATGTTAVVLTPVGDVRSINTVGLLLIETGSASAGAFTFADTGLSNGLIRVRLEQRGGGFYLVATPDVAVFRPLALGNMAKDIWYQTADVYTGYAALRRANLSVPGTRPVQLWAQLYASGDRSGDRESISAFNDTFAADNRVRTDRRGAQFGVDVQPPGTSIALGLTGGLQRARTELRNAEGRFVARGYNIGVYLNLGRATGLYAGMLGKFDKSDVSIRQAGLTAIKGSPDFTSMGIEGEVGYRLAAGSVDLDFGAGLSRVNARVRSFKTEQIGFEFDVAKSLRGRLGARAVFGARLSPYLDGKLYHEFKDDVRLTFISGNQRSTVNARGRGTWGRLEAGIGGRGTSGPIAALWGEMGDVKGFGAKAGFRF